MHLLIADIYKSVAIRLPVISYDLWSDYFCRIIKKVIAEFFVAENIKGLTTLNMGDLKGNIIKHFGRLRYKG